MSDPVLLNNVDHQDCRVAIRRGDLWEDAVNEVTVFPTEFEALSREYVIVFRRNAAGALRPSALLGFARGENLFVEDGRWDARTVPALMQRGPFSIGVPAAGEPGEPMIHINPADPRVGTEGERLFLDHGGNAPYLDHVAGVLRTIYAGDRVAPAMFDLFLKLDLIEEATLESVAPDGRRFTVPDVLILSAERFAALDGMALAALHRGDFLRCAVWAMSSIGNLAALLDRKLARDGRG